MSETSSLDIMTSLGWLNTYGLGAAAVAVHVRAIPVLQRFGEAYTHLRQQAAVTRSRDTAGGKPRICASKGRFHRLRRKGKTIVSAKLRWNVYPTGSSAHYGEVITGRKA